jgi:hypothetical protein
VDNYIAGVEISQYWPSVDFAGIVSQKIVYLTIMNTSKYIRVYIESVSKLIEVKRKTNFGIVLIAVGLVIAIILFVLVVVYFFRFFSQI